MDGNKPTFIERDQLNFQGGVQFTLRVTAQSLITSPVTIFGMTKNGQFTFHHSTTGGNGPESEDFNIGDVPIFIMVFDENNSFYQGDCYVTLDLLAQGDYLYHLCSGYIYGPKKVSYPEVATTDHRPGGGSLYRITGTNPAANVEISDQVPQFEMWKLHSISFQLVTDSNAANREVTLAITGGGDTIFTVQPAAVQIASKTVRYSYAPGFTGRNDTTTLDQTIELPSDLLLGSGDFITTITTNRQVTDNFSAPIYVVEKYPLPS